MSTVIMTYTAVWLALLIYLARIALIRRRLQRAMENRQECN